MTGEAATRNAGFLATALACLVSACAVGPDYRRPDLAVPAAWSEAATTASDSPKDPDWWASFHDPVLSRLVARALTSAPRMKEALARVREARAQRAGEAGSLYPKLGTNLSYSNSRVSEHGFLESFSGGSGGSGGAVVPGQQINLFEAGFDAQWEIDIFGHVRRSVEAAEDEADAMQAAGADVARSLEAEVARDVVEVRCLDERLAIAARGVESQKATLDILHARRAAGVASDADVATVDAALAAIEAEMPTLRSRRAACVHRLEAMVAAGSGTLDSDLASSSGVPEAASLPNPGLPSDLLLRRPDVAVAERELAAATARMGVARAELLPRFSLSGTFGLQSQHIGDLVTTDSRFWYIGPGIRWPIFEAGRLMAAVDVADARTDQAAAHYEAVVRTAIAEVETILASVTQEKERGSALDREVLAERVLVDAARDLYRNGLTGLLNVLDAERSSYRAEDALAASKAALAADAIALYKALGGGWKPAT